MSQHKAFIIDQFSNFRILNRIHPKRDDAAIATDYCYMILSITVGSDSAFAAASRATKGRESA
ncbi:hypothetical protein BN874_1880007 [Candidatus Contendobacter odensis Run_B_J11]|uniref:Uncharacterized protein n=1 Tax=Candidatus Contendobacter odensis Run_B_J11 TaxID=1400861 RepID=A0A7U7GAW3_9GAMM|nr:hypothetical protein BN874_1880007 [Candidatus Contendobacter odensis Run_B_J11]